MKSFIIHLSRIPSSLDSALKLQQELKSIDIDAELFEGTYGSDAEKIFEKEGRKVHPISFKGLGVDERYSNKAKRPGVMGCFYSHYRLWQKCAELNETICVFEDDVAIHRPIIPVAFDDVLIITLGAKKSEKYKHYLYEPSGEPKAEDYYNASMPGTTGYMITPQGARKLLTVYNKTFLASDNAMNVMVVDIKIHNYLVGTANLEKKSLTRSTEFWNKFKNA
jgi:glycosyl transferase family 25